MARGNHLKVDRLFYTHHGIDLGNGNVIHYSGEWDNKENASIRIDSKKVFANGDKVTVVEYVKSDAPSKVIERAMSRLGETNYNFIFHNCEHFATWCKTGKTESRQVAKGVRSLTTNGGVMLAKEASKYLAKEAAKDTAKEASKAIIKQGTKSLAKEVTKQTASNAAKSALKSSAPTAAIFGLGEQIYDTYQYSSGKIDKGEFITSTAGNVGSTGGSIGGAVIGSMICPGVGTVVGGLLGGIFGSFTGRKVGESLC